ncbi:MAG: iron-containing alcohol dehydrogenase [bacterium]|nr:iron-containing alcohol dehydrogenase [bacterium]
MQRFNLFSPTKIIFGEAKIQTLPDFLPVNSNEVLIVTGKNSSKTNGALNIVQTILKDANKKIVIFDEIEPNPLTDTVDLGAKIARENSIDLVLGVGGGSPMDASKCIAMLVNNEGSIKDYIKGKKIINLALPIITIPTTAGTGSEVNQSVVISDSETKTKTGVSSECMFPQFAILDPTFTLSMPYNLTVDTGIDALTHAIEGYLSTKATLSSDKLALESIEIIKEALPQVVKNRKDISLRTQMLYSSMLGGLVISKTGTIMLHAMGYPLTTFYNIPHGRANGILLPTMLEFLKESKVEKINTLNYIFRDNIRKFLNDLGISTKLRDYGIIPEDIIKFLNNVWGRRNFAITPKVVTREDIINLYKQAI